MLYILSMRDSLILHGLELLSLTGIHDINTQLLSCVDSN